MIGLIITCLFFFQDWILTEEEKVLKRRKHRNRDTEKKDADSSSMDCLSDVTPTLGLNDDFFIYFHCKQLLN